MPLVRIFIPLVHALRGDHDLARATFEEFRHMPGPSRSDRGGPRWFTTIGFVALLLDDTDTAERVYQEVSGLPPGYMADGSGVVFCGGATERVGGDLALATGRVDEAIGRYTTAIEMNARIGARPFLALHQAWPGQGAGRQGRGPGTCPPPAPWSRRPPRSSGGSTCPARWPPPTPCSPASTPRRARPTRCPAGNPRLRR